MGIGCFRGSEEEIWGQFLEAATLFRTDVIVEITGDGTIYRSRIGAGMYRRIRK